MGRDVVWDGGGLGVIVDVGGSLGFGCYIYYRLLHSFLYIICFRPLPTISFIIIVVVRVGVVYVPYVPMPNALLLTLPMVFPPNLTVV